MNFEFISTKTGLNLKIILCLIFILKLQKILQKIQQFNLQKILRTVSVPSRNSQLILPVWDTHACYPHLLSRDKYDHKNNRNNHVIFGLCRCSSSFWCINYSSAFSLTLGWRDLSFPLEYHKYTVNQPGFSPRTWELQDHKKTNSESILLKTATEYL